MINLGSFYAIILYLFCKPGYRYTSCKIGLKPL